MPQSMVQNLLWKSSRGHITNLFTSIHPSTHGKQNFGDTTTLRYKGRPSLLGGTLLQQTKDVLVGTCLASNGAVKSNDPSVCKYCKEVF